MIVTIMLALVPCGWYERGDTPLGSTFGIPRSPVIGKVKENPTLTSVNIGLHLLTDCCTTDPSGIQARRI